VKFSASSLAEARVTVYSVWRAPVQVINRKWRVSGVSTWQRHWQDGVRWMSMSSFVLSQSVGSRRRALHTS